MSLEILSAFVIGLFGSLHCIGMCGPIAFALPVAQQTNVTFLLGRLLYNLGRVITYFFMGIIFGLLGGKVMMAGLQQSLSIALGLFIIIYVILPQKYKTKILLSSAIISVTTPLKKSIGSLFKKGTIPSLFFIGLLNGFLPCGFVYIGLAGAAATGDAFSGGMFMFLFGLGTVPIMFIASYFGKVISIDIRKKLLKAVPVFAVVIAVIFILRGMNLGIPYISPKLGTVINTSSESNCH
ncbi:MAG: sulfite exporter TauE/SafE family protein [Ignavibacteriales bacterium]|nr:MAG: sulfite exporter TauE/SafE family protein [Ignavibacteriales bacterium]